MVYKALAALALLAIILLGSSYYSFRQDLMRVYEAPDPQMIGPSQADLTVVMFTDYGCLSCQAVYPVLIEAIKRDGNVRFIPRPVFLGETQKQLAVLFLYAAARQGKFEQAHEKLIDTKGVINDAILADITFKLGLDKERLVQDIQSPEVLADAQLNDYFFKRWGLKEMPSLLIGRMILLVPPQMPPDADGFLELFQEARL